MFATVSNVKMADAQLATRKWRLCQLIYILENMICFQVEETFTKFADFIHLHEILGSDSGIMFTVCWDVTPYLPNFTASHPTRL